MLDNGRCICLNFIRMKKNRCIKNNKSILIEYTCNKLSFCYERTRTMVGPEVFTFKKTLKERLDEYQDILCCRGIKVPSCQVMQEWKFYLSHIVEPSGWKALWKLSRISCDEFAVKFPSVVYVEVLDVDLDILCATINILAVHGNEDLPEQIQVPLQQLYPTKRQTSELLNIVDTANTLDQFRFFMNHIWQPWDVEDDDSLDWASEHLESRIHLHNDMLSKTVFRAAREHIRELLSIGRTVHSQFTMLEESVNDVSELKDDDIVKLMELNLQKNKIKTELQMLENPVMRNAFARKMNAMAVSKRSPSDENFMDVCLILHRGSVDKCIKSLEQTARYVNSDTAIRQSPSLQDTLDEAMAKYCILLCAGVHEVRDSCALEEEGFIKGMYTPDKTILQACTASIGLFDCSSDMLVFENVTLDAHLVQTALIVRQGIVNLRNCTVVCKDMSCRGVVVFAGAKLEAQDCCFIGLQTAIIVDNEAEAELTSCKFSECNFGLQLYDQSKVTLQKCSISGCKNNGIRIDCLLQGNVKTGSIAVLEGHSNIKMEDTVVENNAGGDVAIGICNMEMFYGTGS